MLERQRFKPIDPLDSRLSEESERLRNEARGTHLEWGATGLFAGRGLRKPPPT
jgi:hypothetical protein